MPVDVNEAMKQLKKELNKLTKDGAVSSPPRHGKTEVMKQLKSGAESYPEANNVGDKKTFNNVGVTRGGEQIIIPDGMSFQQAIDWLERREAEENQNVGIMEQVEGYPLDGALAFMKALQRRFGWVNLVPTPGFFGDQPPTMVGVEVGPNEVVQVPWGRIQIPGVSGYVQTSVGFKDGKPLFVLAGEVKQKHKGVLSEIAQTTREIVKNESIYRGKAIRVSFPAEYNPLNFSPLDHCPKFMDTTATKVEELIFPEDVATLVNTALFTPIERTALCRKHRVPLKRGILLEGPYGTGKTKTAEVTAKKCVENGWTYIYVADVNQLQQAIQFARQYSPAVIFAEDVDQVLRTKDEDYDEDVSGGRTQEMNDILNTIDGVDTKHEEIMVILTTNHLENINQAMLRPGRLDAVIPVRPPDQQAVERLLRLYGRGLLDNEIDLSDVSKRLAGNIPAFIREVVERSKLAAISHLGEFDELTLTTEDLVQATDSMLSHLKLLEPRPVDRRDSMEKFAHIVGGFLVEGVKKAAPVLGNSTQETTVRDN
jgi:SpoVK/Ycf46/Vps4 family AAA+-type ATPase